MFICIFYFCHLLMYFSHVVCSGWWWKVGSPNTRDNDNDGNAYPMVYSPETIRMGLAADITGGHPTTILRDGMPDKLNPGVYLAKP